MLSFLINFSFSLNLSLNLSLLLEPKLPRGISINKLLMQSSDVNYPLPNSWQMVYLLIINKEINFSRIRSTAQRVICIVSLKTCIKCSNCQLYGWMDLLLVQLLNLALASSRFRCLSLQFVTQGNEETAEI